jgi:hypothetical protein
MSAVLQQDVVNAKELNEARQQIVRLVVENAALRNEIRTLKIENKLFSDTCLRYSAPHSAISTSSDCNDAPVTPKKTSDYQVLE